MRFRSPPRATLTVVCRAVPTPFPGELLESPENPPILITSHSHSNSHSTPHSHRNSPSSAGVLPSRFNATLNSAGMPVPAGPSPSSSPTAPEFPHTGYHTHSHYDGDPPPRSPVPDRGAPSPKRQRTAQPPPPQQHERKLPRARSDSAPLGYGFGHVQPQTQPYPGGAHLGRPRSGSNLAGAGAGHAPRRDDCFLGPAGARLLCAPAPSAFSAGRSIKDEPAQHPS